MRGKGIGGAALALALFLCACGGQGGASSATMGDTTSTTQTSTTQTTTTTQATPRLTVEGTVHRLTGEWSRWLTPVTEKEEQNIGSKILKKVRLRDTASDDLLSVSLKGRLTVAGQTYLWCEVSWWVTDEDGRVTRREPITDLVVPEDLSAGYEATAAGGQLVWDTAADRFR